MGTLVAEQAAKLLDFTQPQIDVQLLDNVVSAMYHGQGPQQRAAQDILTRLKEHPDSWTRVDAILEFSTNSQTKYYALQILEKLVNTRWKTLPREQCDGIKNYIVSLVIKISSESAMLESEKLYLSKLNMVLVQIVKREWPQHWPKFISEIVGASRTNESLCQNNMVILKLLSEEVFDFSAGQMTQTRAQHLKEKLCNEFSEVFHLCQFVMENSQNATLVEATLETLLKFSSWLPLGYIFETPLIETLTRKFFNVPMFRNVTLQCLTEIAGVTISATGQDTYDNQFIALFLTTMSQLRQMLFEKTDIKKAYANGTDMEQKFIANLALFLTTFLKEHYALIDAALNSEPPREYKQETTEAHNSALIYLLAISEVDETEIFKICLDYWNWLAAELYRECPFYVAPFGAPYGYGMPTNDQRSAMAPPNLPAKRRLFQVHMRRLRYIMIERMAKPEEVLVVENDQGEVVRETIKDTDAINLYKTMRETLVYLTHLDYMDTERIMTEKLQNQVNGIEWSWKNLNTLCWAIGSISGSMAEEDEKRFLVTVIRDLLGLCEQKRGKDNKAVIAANIMYVVGQYPRFLRAHWKFLKTVVNKLFEFMHETHEGVQDMACDTFIKIAQKCRRHFIIHQPNEVCPFIDEILINLNSIINDLAPSQVHVFYEAMGFLICAVFHTPTQESLLERLMSLPNTVWDEIISHAAQNVDVLKEPEVVKNLANILKTNVATCKSVGHPFLTQLSRIYLDMLNVYKVTSENISAAVTLHGEAVLKQPLIRSMRGVKTEILRLISTWVSKSDDNENVLTNFVPPLFEAVLFDYMRNVPAAREPEVLLLMTTIVIRLQSAITSEVPKIFDAVFECTLNMINKDFEEFPEHRANFFLLLQAVTENCFDAFLKIPQPQFKLVLDSIIWAFKHSMRNVAEIGLEILLTLLNNVATKTPEEAAQSFYQSYFIELLEHILSVVTDSSQAQVAGLTYYAKIMAHMFKLVECGNVKAPFNPATPNNVEYLFEFVATLLKKAFPHLSDGQIRVIVKGFYTFDNDPMNFKDHLRDFLVQIKEYAGEDTTYLYLEEREKELHVIAADKDKIKAAVPGILNPHEVTEDAMLDFM